MGIKKIIMIMAVLFVLAMPLLAEDCYECDIISPYPFMGNDGERFKLSDGTEWEVAQDKVFLFLYEYHPKILICPDQGKMKVGEKILNVDRKGDKS